MAVIEKELELAGSKGREKVMALFDSGATYSCIEREIANRLEVILPFAEPLRFATAREGDVMESNERVSLFFYLDGYRFSDEFFIVPGLSEKVIIGAATMQKWRFKLDFENDTIIVDPRVTKSRLLKHR